MTLLRSQLNDDVVAVLRDRIYTGRYPAGHHLRQEQLAEEFGISRTPLREAFRTLASEGLLEVLPGRGVRVVALDLARVLAAYEVRAVLDGLAARLAARGRPERLRALFEETVGLQRRALAGDDFAAYTSENVRFHIAIWEAADNEFLVAQQQVLRLTAQMLGPQRILPASLAGQAVDAHEEIARAVLAGDEAEAERQARAHIHATIATLSAG